MEKPRIVVIIAGSPNTTEVRDAIHRQMTEANAIHLLEAVRVEEKPTLPQDLFEVLEEMEMKTENAFPNMSYHQQQKDRRFLNKRKNRKSKKK